MFAEEERASRVADAFMALTFMSAVWVFTPNEVGVSPKVSQPNLRVSWSKENKGPNMRVQPTQMSRKAQGRTSGGQRTAKVRYYSNIYIYIYIACGGGLPSSPRHA